MPFCARYRLGYPQRLIARVIDIVGLKPGDKMFLPPDKRVSIW